MKNFFFFLRNKFSKTKKLGEDLTITKFRKETDKY